MGEAATVGLSAVGGIAGSMSPLGWMGGAEIGMTLGSLFTQPKPPTYDLKPTVSQYGNDIPQFWGSVTIGCQLIWALPLNNNNGGSKNQKDGQAPTYSASWCVAVGEARPNTTLGRVWYDDILILDNISPGADNLFYNGSTYVPSEAEVIAFFGFTEDQWNAMSDSQQFGWDQEYVDQHEGNFNPIYGNDGSGGLNIITLHVGGASQTVDPMLLAAGWDTSDSDPVGSSGQGSPAYRHLTTINFDNVDVQGFGNMIPNVRVQLVETGVTLDEIVTDVCMREGFASDQIDVSLIASGSSAYPDGIAVEGCVRKSATDFDQFLTTLLSIYQCDYVQVDGVIRVVPRGGDPVATIPETDIGAFSTEGNEPQAPYKLTIQDERETPYYFSLDFMDSWNLNQSSTQYAWRTDTVSLQRQQVSFDIVATDTQAQTWVTQLLYAAWQDRYKYEFTVGWKYAWLCPTDVLTLWNGDRVRITEIGVGTFAELNVTAVRDGGGVPSLTGTTGGSEAAAPVSYNGAHTQFYAWSGQELTPLDGSNPGFYVAACGAQNENIAWPGCTVYYSPDDGTTWILAGTIKQPSIIGVALTALADGDVTAPTYDTTSTANVATFAGRQLGSSTSAEVLAGGNMALLGEEYIAFETATPTVGAPNYQYDLTDLQRGLLGTSETGHAVGDPFVQVSSPGPLRVIVSESLIGQEVLVKCVGPFDTLAEVTQESVTIANPNAPYVTSGEVTTTIDTAITAALAGLTGWQLDSGADDGTIALSKTPTSGGILLVFAALGEGEEGDLKYLVLLPPSQYTNSDGVITPNSAYQAPSYALYQTPGTGDGAGTTGITITDSFGNVTTGVTALIGKTDTFTGDGSTVEFALANIPVGDITCFLEGAGKIPRSSISSVSGVNVTLNAAPADGAVLEIEYQYA